MTVLIVSSRLEFYLKPYKREENTKVEILAIMAGVVTMNSGLVYSQDDTISFLNIVVLVFVIVFNLFFVIEWTYLLS